MGAQIRTILVIVAILAVVGAAGFWLHSTTQEPLESETAGQGHEEGERENLAAVPSGDNQGSDSQPAGETVPPSFDIVRVEPTGDLVAAGRASSKAHVMLLNGDAELESADANSIGEWAIVLDEPLAPGSYDLLLRATGPDGKGGPVDGDRVTVVIEGPDTTPLVALMRPGQPTEVLQQPQGETVVAAVDTVQEQSPGTASNEISQTPAVGTPAEGASAPGQSASSTGEQDTSQDKAPVADSQSKPRAAQSQTGDAQTSDTQTSDTQTSDAQTSDAQTSGTQTSGTQTSGTQTSGTQTSRDQAGGSETGQAQSGQVQADQQDPGRQEPGHQEPGRQEPGQQQPGTTATGSPDESSGTSIASASTEPRVTGSPDESSGTASAEPSAVEPDGNVSIKTVEVEDTDKLMLSGEAEPGDAVRLYLNNEQLADVETNADGRWTLSSERPMPPGRYELRADVVGGAGDVTARAQVKFDRVQVVSEDDVAAEKGEAAGISQNGEASDQPGSVVTIVSRADGSGTATSSGSAIGEGAGTSVVVIARGDNLWRIARKIYGKGVRHSVIFEANKNQIGNPDLIYPGQVFTIPVLEGENG